MTGQEPVKNTEHYFGGCPECGGQSGYLNVGGNHWAVCDAHKVKWPIGYNLFSDWHDETEDVWAGNAATLAGYRLVEPLAQEKPDPEPTNRWQAMSHTAYAIDGEALTANEVADRLVALKNSFPDCDPQADFEGAAVNHFLRVIILAFRPELRRMPDIDSGINLDELFPAPQGGEE